MSSVLFDSFNEFYFWAWCEERALQCIHLPTDVTNLSSFLAFYNQFFLVKVFSHITYRLVSVVVDVNKGKICAYQTLRTGFSKELIKVKVSKELEGIDFLPFPL